MPRRGGFVYPKARRWQLSELGSNLIAYLVDLPVPVCIAAQPPDFAVVPLDLVNSQPEIQLREWHGATKTTTRGRAASVTRDPLPGHVTVVYDPTDDRGRGYFCYDEQFGKDGRNHSLSDEILHHELRRKLGKSMRPFPPTRGPAEKASLARGNTPIVGFDSKMAGDNVIVLAGLAGDSRGGRRKLGTSTTSGWLTSAQRSPRNQVPRREVRSSPSRYALADEPDGAKRPPRSARRRSLKRDNTLGSTASGAQRDCRGRSAARSPRATGRERSHHERPRNLRLRRPSR
jgi:hypothetical protein